MALQQPITQIAVRLATWAALLPATKCSADTSIPDLIEKVEPSVVRVEVDLARGTSMGSGFVTNGVVVTNWHVVEGALSVKVVFSDKVSHESDGLLSFDAEKDVAVLSVPDLKGRQGIPVSEDLPRKGETVIACGAPRGFSFTTSDGIVSGIRTSEEIREELDKELAGENVTWIQTTAPISEGNSGGPLVCLNGAVCGINTWYHKGGQNLNFASACTEISTVLRAASTSKVTAFNTAAKASKPALDDAEALIQRVLVAQHKSKFDEALRRAVVEYRRTKNLYEKYSRDPSVSSERLLLASEAHEAAKRTLEHLKNWTPKVNSFLDDSSLVGWPGRWFVFQVIGPDELLVKQSRSSSDVFLLRGYDTAGMVDEVHHDFEGVWYTTGETYSYTTVAGATRTTYVLRSNAEPLIAHLAKFRDIEVTPEVERQLATLGEVTLPNEAEAREIDRQRAAIVETKNREAALRIALAEQRDSEEAAGRLIAMADRFNGRKPEVERQYLQSAIDDHPNTVGASIARARLGLRPIEANRIWQSGNHTTRAALVAVDGDKVTLRKEGGGTVKVPMSRLSLSDQEYLRRWAASRNEP